jgi:dTDP-4-dehydrorhamnose reductase
MTEQRPILVFGGTGMLGGALVRALGSQGRPCEAPGRDEIDLASCTDLEQSIEARNPCAVINAAAFSDVTAAELPTHHAAAFELNHRLPARLAKLHQRLGLKLVHVSTDYVFDGRQERPYAEDSPTAALQVYGRSKLAGEVAVLDTCANALVVRTSTLFGPGRRERPNYVDAIARQARKKERLDVVRLPVSSPTFAPDLAVALVNLLDLGAKGLVHVVNEGGCSRLELARETVRLAGLAAKVAVHERPQPANDLARPAYSVLDTSRYRKLTGQPLRPWQEALAEHLAAG